MLNFMNDEGQVRLFAPGPYCSRINEELLVAANPSWGVPSTREVCRQFYCVPDGKPVFGPSHTTRQVPSRRPSETRFLGEISSPAIRFRAHVILAFFAAFPLAPKKVPKVFIYL